MDVLLAHGFAEVAEKLQASVVQVTARGHGHGAGTIWRSDGLVATNHHVAPGEGNQVRLADGRTLPARALARDPANDLALLKVEARGLPAVAIGDARRLRVGELVVAVGHPFGMRNAVTVGTVNALPRLDEPGQGREIVQADVRLLPGNSGGPLANARGEVVGINAMVAGGLGLAVPSHLVERLVNSAAAERASLGIRVQRVELRPTRPGPVTAEAAALVVGVLAGSPAEAADVQLGDVIMAVDGHVIDGVDGLYRALTGHTGGVIRLGLLRGGEPREVIVMPRRPADRAA